MVRRSVLCVTDRLRGHATAGIRGAFYRHFFTGEQWDFDLLDVNDVGAEAVLAAARDRDCIVLVKVASYSLVRALRNHCPATLVFDLSDALWKPVHRRAGWHDLERILGAVDRIVCENDFLKPFATRYRAPHARVVSAPTSVPLEAFDAKRRPREESPARIVIGWVGSRTTAAALYKVREPLARLALRHPGMHVRLLGVSEGVASKLLGEIPHSALERYDEAVMIEEMAALDVGLYPEPYDREDYIARGPLKAFLYMASGLPVVCSPGGECSRLIQDGVSGMLAATPAEWERKLESLLRSGTLRAGMGQKALETVRATQTPDVLYGELREAILTSPNPVASGAAPTRMSHPYGVRVFNALRSHWFRSKSLAARAVRMVKQRGRRSS